MSSHTPASARRSRRVLWINLALIGAFLVVVGLAFAFLRPSGAPPAPGAADSETPGASAPPTLRDDSHVLGEPGASGVTVVEFLDFECEACGAFYPLVESLREQYAGEVTFVARYFPLDGHRNSKTAAVAVEAAAQQGAFEAMYAKLFETQAAWGEQADSKASLFREYAAELGLDLAAYDAAVAEPATLERVQSDQADGYALGVQGTPTFFIDDRMVQLQSYDDLGLAIDAALEQRDGDKGVG